jgi:hypothetical protein
MLERRAMVSPSTGSGRSTTQQAQVRGSEGGFRAVLRNASLWDLVQLQCQARARCVVRITSSGATAYLYFSDGQIVHANMGSLQGEQAAIEILSWTRGSWGPCERPWPERPNVTTPWQGLLLRAAQLIDEAKPPDSRSGITLPPPAAAPGESAEVRTLQQQAVGRAATRESSGVSFRPDDFEHAVRFSAQGSIITGQGQVEEFAVLAAYVGRVGDLIGALIGVGKLVAFDATLLRGTQCLIFRHASGDTIALRPRAGVDLSQLRIQLAL